MNGVAQTGSKNLGYPDETRPRQSPQGLPGAVAMLVVAAALSACDASASYNYPVLGSDFVAGSASAPPCSTP